MNIKCRACLATIEAKMYHSLLTVFPEYTNTNLKVLNLLEIVTSTTVDISCGLPDTICTACLKQLKDCYKFISQFKDAQLWLQQNYCDDLEDKSEQIIIKFDSMDEKYISSFNINLEGGDIFLETIDEHKNKSILKQVTKQLKATSTKVRVKKKTIKRKNLSKPTMNNDGFIVMSIEDVLQDGENIVHNLPDTLANKNYSEENKEDTIIHIDHSYQKTCESSDLNKNPSLISVDNVRHASTTRSRKTEANRTQLTVSEKNLERNRTKTRVRIRKTDKQKADTFLCEICSKVFDSYRKLISHKWNMHIPTGSQEKCKCPICGVICRTRSAFNHHKRKHKGKSYCCDECGKSYLTITQIREHKRSKHGDGLAEKYLCKTCGLQFNFKATLRYHLISRHSENNRKNMCKYCDYRCIQKSYLKRHERCHTDERPYKCKYCDKRFRGIGDLSQHRLSHEGKFKYLCQYCGKGFLTTWNMKVHWLQHGGNYGCEICHRSFIDGNVLKFHYFHHHKIRNEDKETCDDIVIKDCDEGHDKLDAVFYEAPTTAEDLFILD